MSELVHPLNALLKPKEMSSASANLKISETPLPGILYLEQRVYRDDRGFFMETFHEEKFRAAGIPARFVQDNHSGSQKNTLRGLHYQLKHAQGKLVYCVAGEVFDVSVDIRRSSPTFGRWAGFHLSAENKAMLWIPPWFAHGFYVLSDWAEVQYKTTDFYTPAWERTLLWNDPQVGIDWPLRERMPLLSSKDRSGARLSEADLYD